MGLRGRGQGELIVPDGVFARPGGVADAWCHVSPGPGEMPIATWGAAVGGGVVGPMEDERAGDEVLIPGTDEGVVANFLRELAGSVLVGLRCGKLDVLRSVA